MSDNSLKCPYPLFSIIVCYSLPEDSRSTTAGSYPWSRGKSKGGSGIAGTEVELNRFQLLGPYKWVISYSIANM